MKKDKDAPPKSAEGKPAAKRAPAKAKKTRKKTESVRLPFLIELTYSLSSIILILLALAIMITSYLAGASLFVIVLRTGVAVTIVGALLMLIASQISSGLLFSVKIDQEEEKRKQEEAMSTANEDLNEAEAS